MPDIEAMHGVRIATPEQAALFREAKRLLAEQDRFRDREVRRLINLRRYVRRYERIARERAR
jgi:hypothetical protein